MKTSLLLLIAASLLPLSAADPDGFLLWHKGVPPAAAKSAKFSNHQMSVSHREKDGIAEVHETQTDIFVIQSGGGVILVGGEVVGGKTTAPGEIRGGTIKNGVRKNVSAGDVVHIPARTPHQFFVAAGKEVTYFVVKVDTH